MRKGIKKQFWLSKEEAAELKRKSQCTCLSEVAVIRYLIMGYEPKPKADERFFEAMRELSAIGNNLNQLAAKANSLGFVDAPMLYNEVKRWHKFQADIESVFLRPEKMNLKWQ